MIQDFYVLYRGKKHHISTLKPYSQKLVTIKCPVCRKIYKRRFHILATSGNLLCQQCTIKNVFEKPLAPGNRYGRLVVIKPSTKTGYSICKCDCRNIVEIDNTNLRKGHTKSCGCLKKDTMKKIRVNYSGEKHGNWQGGITGKRQSLMMVKKYREWRDAVFKRDGYICQKCNEWSRNLNAHHILDYKTHKEKIYEIDNGITLCENCHRKFHKLYGRTKLSKQMTIDFLESNKFRDNQNFNLELVGILGG